MAWLNVAKIIDVTQAEGPGLRTAIWVQGCLKRCVGCCNGQFLKIQPADVCDSKMIIEQHCHGSLFVENTDDGAKFTITFHGENEA